MNELRPLTIPYRIRIGAAGGRSPSQVETLRKSVSRVLGNQPRESKILELLGPDHATILTSIRNTQIAFTFVTSYYEGANQLLAEEILKLDGSRIHLVLPYVEGEFEKQYSTEAGRDAFRKLLKNDAIIRAPIRLPADGGDLKEAGLRAHRYIVDHCDVVLVIGDQPNADEEALLRYANHKRRPIIRIHNNSEITFETGYGLNEKSFLRLEQYNRYNISPEEIEAYSANVYKDTFEQDGSGETIPQETKSLIRKLLTPHYARASVVAKEFQRNYKIAGNLMYFFSVLAVVSVAIAIEFKTRYGYLFELALLAFILFAVLFSRVTASHKRWIETRFLAERIRSATILAAAGVEVSPIYLPPYMGAAHRQDDWMVMAFHEIWEQMPAMKGCQGEQCSLISTFVCKTWIDDQIHYHANKAKKFHTRNHRLESIGWGVFGLALLVAFSHIFFHPEEVNEKYLIILALTLPAAAASMEGIRKHNEYSRLATLSENMEENLRELKQRFQEIRSSESLDALLREADELMLRETQGWLMLMRFLKLEPVL